MIKFTAPEDRIIRSVTSIVTEKVTEKENDVLVILTNDPGLTSEAIATKLGVSRKTISVRLSSLKKKGVITRIVSDKKGYWQINQ